MANTLHERPAVPSADWTVPQNWPAYSQTEHDIWNRLFERQIRMLPERVAPRFIAGLQRLELDRPGIPDFETLSAGLLKMTGWRVVAVPGLVPDEVFFEHLSQRRFVAGRFIRSASQLDYLEEPDIFHDVFGHVPLLTDPVFADYMQAYGEGGLRALRLGALERISRLYWYTVEFGLVRDAGRLRVYGAGIVSSHGESRFALEDPSPHRVGFDLTRVMRTRYRIDDYQQTYFVIDSFEDLLRQTLETDFGPLYARLAAAPDLPADALLPTDRLYTRGTQAHAHMRAAAP